MRSAICVQHGEMYRHPAKKVNKEKEQAQEKISCMSPSNKRPVNVNREVAVAALPQFVRRAIQAYKSKSTLII